MIEALDIGKEAYTIESNKRVVQKLSYNQIRGFRADSVVLPGPSETMEDYLTLVSKTVSKPGYKIHGYEICPTRWAEQVEKLTQHSILRDRVIIHKRSVHFANPKPFMDIDLCGTARKHKKMLSSLYSIQRDTIDGRKVFMFTTCLRSCGDEETIGILGDLVGGIRSWRKYKKVPGEPFFRFNIQAENKDVKIDAFNYKDGAPMFSCLIDYQ